MGYSPTEYAEFTEPPTEMSSHGFHRFTQMLRMRCSPTEYAEFTEFGSVGMAGMLYPPTSVRIRAHLWEALLCQKFLCVPCVLREYLFSHGWHRLTQMVGVRCSPTEFTEFTEFGSVGMAGMPYPPTSVNIRVISGRFFSARGSVSSVLICGRLFSARSFCAFRAFCGNIFSPTEFTEYTEFGSVGMAGMPYPPTSVRICAICGRLFSARSFCEFRAFCGNIFSPTEFTEFTEFGSVGMAGMPYPPTSVRIRAHLWEALLCQKFLCVPCVLWEYLFSHRIHRIHRIWQRGYGRDAIPSYICEHPCHQWKVLLCKRFCEFRAHLWEALLCQKFLCVPCVLWEYLFSHRIHRIHRICQRGYGRDAIPSYICAHPCHLWESLLCQKFP